MGCRVEIGFLIFNLHVDITKETRIDYMHYFCDIYRDYNNKTLSSLDKLERIYPMLFEYDESILRRVDTLKTRLSWRLNHSEKLIQEVIAEAEELRDLIKNKNHVIQKPRVLYEARGMLRDFETGLKYIPQTYFETEKLVRYAWYNYEAYTVLHNL